MGRRSNFQLGLIGWPVGHSLSPVIHQAALSACGVDGKYDLFPIQPFPAGRRDLAEVLERVRHGDIQGLNVTIPHKQNVIPLLDELSASAQEIGAVNTIYCQDGKLIGDNTDAAGFLNDLYARYSMKGEKNALVLGAGGSSRAVVYALSRDRWQVTVAARRIEQAQALAQDLSGGGRFEISAIYLDTERLQGVQSDLLVNTTPVGMLPDVFASPWPDDAELPQNCFVYDLVYRPAETLLLRQAGEAGLGAVNGLGMLVEQAALSFEIWTGYTAPRLVMQMAVRQRLQEIQNEQEVGNAA